MARIVVLATGGTIASRFDESGSASAVDRGAYLLADLGATEHDVEAIDVLTLNSFLLTSGHMRMIVDEIARQVARDDVWGVVVAHGTDTLEETAFAAALTLSQAKPIVFTGAQRTPDSAGADGRRNLRDAVRVAAEPSSKNRGVMVVFGGGIFSAIGCRKVDTLKLSCFAAVNFEPLGEVLESEVRFAFPSRFTPEPLNPIPMTERFDHARVDIVTLYPGVDATCLHACVARGSRAVVLGGMGAGNGNAEVLSWVTDAVADGVFVALSTRVPFGRVSPMYGDGGGASLIAAGAVSTGPLQIFQARILVALLASVSDQGLAGRVRAAIHWFDDALTLGPGRPSGLTLDPFASSQNKAPLVTDDDP